MQVSIGLGVAGWLEWKYCSSLFKMYVCIKVLVARLWRRGLEINLTVGEKGSCNGVCAGFIYKNRNVFFFVA